MQEKLKYPIGQFSLPGNFTNELMNGYIKTISDFPGKITNETKQLSKEQLETPYRPGGWTVRQVVNHCADSHMNAIIRVKLALSDETPTILPYPQEIWAEMSDSKNMDISSSLSILKGVHERWTMLLNSFKDKEWSKGYIHPEKGRKILLNESTASYAWHCEHHLAHITELKKRKGW